VTRIAYLLASISLIVACDPASVDQTSQAVSSPVTLAECFDMLATDVHAACTDVGPAPSGRGTAPSADGFVAVPGDDPLGVEASIVDDAPVGSPAVDIHCNAEDVPSLVAARGAAFRACVRERTDKGAGCASLGDTACPPGLDEAECAGAREAAAALCEDEVAAL